MPEQRQAVILIHGIGRQQPMETLSGFVDAVWRTDHSIHHQYSPSTVWSKPDDVSESFELRRLTTGQNRNGIRTDFFEFYWSHLMTGTSLTQVWDWVKFLLLRAPRTVPTALRGIYGLLWVTMALATMFLVNAMLPNTDKFIQIPGWISVIAGIAVFPLVGRLLKEIVGDAARYLYPAPANIQRRHEIRHAGVALLQELHQRDKYQRIIVVGHSLGRVIGYDILRYYWAQVHDQHGQPARPKHNALDDLEAFAQSDASKLPINEIRKAQDAYFKELETNGFRWRVTDFITLGSPLAHAEVLLAQDKGKLADKRESRELPTCLPLREKDRFGNRGPHFSYSVKYQREGSRRKQSIRVAHHAAVFAPTRWTNLYFPAKHIIRGDVIAGPLVNCFGWGIQDVPVHTDQRGGCFAHTLYWEFDHNEDAPPHIHALRDALDLANDQGAIK